MDIAQRIEQALADVLTVYGRTPEFGSGNAPEKYAVYNITELGGEYAEGEDGCTKYLCRISVFTPVLDFGLYREIKSAMRASDFGYSSGGQIGQSVDRYHQGDFYGIFPYITQYYLDFMRVEDNSGNE